MSSQNGSPFANGVSKKKKKKKRLFVNNDEPQNMIGDFNNGENTDGDDDEFDFSKADAPDLK